MPAFPTFANTHFTKQFIKNSYNLKITFNIDYTTQWGQRIIVLGDSPELGAGDPAKGLSLDYLPGGKWKQTIQISGDTKTLAYRYALIDDQGSILDEEWHHYRKLDLAQYPTSEIELHDSWRRKHHPENGLDNSAFQRVIFQDKTYPVPSKKPSGKIAGMQFRLQAPRVAPGQRICMLGNTPELGSWDASKPVLLGNKNYPIWQATIPAPQTSDIEYKYGLYDTAEKQLLFLEDGPNRRLFSDLALRRETTVVNDIFFQHPGDLWKGAGLSIPVFSLRTNSSFGVGAFSDIRLLVEWAKSTGMKMVQILPINDTSATFTWKDSYPYAAISVFALHPLYLDLEKLPGFDQVINQKKFRKNQQELNRLEAVDYETVIKWKFKYAREVFQKKKKDFLKDKDVKKFLRNHRHWLQPYAYFCTLRDQYGTVNFNEWKTDQQFSERKMKAAVNPKSENFDAIAFYYYLQYHLDRQLLEVADYARDHQVVLKGDIPIGIYRYSVDAWTQPQLYHMDSQSGAPPDPFSDLGQNWGFPTYNWPEMAKNGYQWWQNRLQTLSRYFDAFRIDHILGFFRIWQIPLEQVEGTLGYFNPAIPVTMEEFQSRGISFDYGRFCQPFITTDFLQELFGEEAGFVIDTFLEPYGTDRFRLRPEFDTQRKVAAHFQQEDYDKPELKTLLFKLHSNVLFIEDPKSGGTAFHPRIDMQKTHVYRNLDGHLQHQLNELYQDYFYHRQEDFWREQAMTKLPAIKEATDMLICGEDLGMIPACVPEVMRELDLFTLEIQRMSKNPKTEFIQSEDIPYFSVCSPSTHDMSPIRAWWEEMEPAQRQRFYQQELQFGGEAPPVCQTHIAEKIILQHLQFPSMWAVFPIQDLLGIDAELRHPVPLSERINIPAVAEHYWQYRLHLSLEELIEAETFNLQLREMMEHTGRGSYLTTAN